MGTPSSPGWGTARGCSTTARGRAAVLIMSAVVGMLLRLHRIKRGEQSPMSRTTKRAEEEGGIAWSPRTRVSKTSTPVGGWVGGWVGIGEGVCVNGGVHYGVKQRIDSI